MITLPPLPKVLKHREADFGLQFRSYIKENWKDGTATFELKQTKGDSLPFSSLEEHQIVYNLAPKKLIRVQGSIGEPDYVYVSDAPAYIAIRFKRGFCIITIDAFLKEKTSSKRRSLTAERAKEIAYMVVKL